MTQLPHASLPQWWREVCRERGGKPALRQKRRGLWTTLSWADWYARSRALGLALAARGLQQGEVVSLLADNRVEWLVADLAVQAVGGIAHGLYPSSSAAELARVLAAAGTRVLVVDGAAQLGKWLEVRAQCPSLQLVVVMDPRGLRDFADPQVIGLAALMAEGEALAAGDAAVFERAIDAGAAEQPAMLLSSAGSTGPAGSSLVRQRGVLQQMRTAPRWLEIDAGERSLSLVSLAHPGERMLAIGAPLATGCIVHFPESRATLLNDLREVAPQLVFATPRFWRQLQQRIELAMRGSIPLARRAYGRALAQRGGWLGRAALHNLRRSLGLQHIRMAISGGAALDDAQVDWYAALEVPLFDGYGMAQTAGFCSVTRLHRTQAAQGHGAPLRLDERGQVLVRGAGLLAEAWGQDPGHGAARDAEGWFATGDHGRQDADGRVRILGRLGEGAAPGIAERALRQSGFIADALVFDDCDASDGQCGFGVAIVALDEERIGHHAQEHQLAFTDPASLARHPAIVACVAAEVEAVNQRLPAAQQVRAFRIIERWLSDEDEELAPTLQLRRHVVERLYAPLIAEMRGSQGCSRQQAPAYQRSFQGRRSSS